MRRRSVFFSVNLHLICLKEINILHKLLKTIMKFIIIAVGLSDDSTAKQWMIKAEKSQDVEESKGCELRKH